MKTQLVLVGALVVTFACGGDKRVRRMPDARLTSCEGILEREDFVRECGLEHVEKLEVEATPMGRPCAIYVDAGEGYGSRHLLTVRFWRYASVADARAVYDNSWPGDDGWRDLEGIGDESRRHLYGELQARRGAFIVDTGSAIVDRKSRKLDCSLQARDALVELALARLVARDPADHERGRR